jgi:hypothetical protein
MSQIKFNEPDDDLYDDVSGVDITCWETLFGYTAGQARREIKTFRADYSRPRWDELWEEVHLKKEDEGYDQEAWEYSLSPQRLLYGQRAFTGNTTSHLRQMEAPSTSTFLIQLEGLIDSPEKIRDIASLLTVPSTHTGTSLETAELARFCKISSRTRSVIFKYLSDIDSDFRPTIVRLTQASKDLDPHSISPTLGADSTLPHHRPVTVNDTRLRPAQSQYPVWYFFYGTLTMVDVLQKHLSLTTEPELVPATLHKGRLRTWGSGRYKSLVDNSRSGGPAIDGKAYLVQNGEQEDELCFYETDKYEVVRCEIHLHTGTRVRGLTFRFCGRLQDLDPE